MSDSKASITWIKERAMGIAIVPCSFFLIFKTSKILKSSGDLSDYFTDPVSFVFILLFFLTSCLHSLMGIDVIVEDYVACPYSRLGVLGFVRSITYFSMFIFFISAIFGFITANGAM